MTAHIRQQIRAALAGALTGLTTTGANVFVSRTIPTSDAQLPCLLIYTRTEKSAFDGMGDDLARPLARQPQVMVVGCCRVAGAEVDDTLDTIATEVEVALAAAMNADQLGGLVDRLELVVTDFDVPPPADGQPTDKRAGRIGLMFRCETTTQAGDPTVKI